MNGILSSIEKKYISACHDISEGGIGLQIRTLPNSLLEELDNYKKSPLKITVDIAPISLAIW